MKTIITFLTATVLVAGITGAMAADQQGSNEAAGYALSHQVGGQFGGAYASARAPGQVRNSTIAVSSDFQAQGRY